MREFNVRQNDLIALNNCYVLVLLDLRHGSQQPKKNAYLEEILLIGTFHSSHWMKWIFTVERGAFCISFIVYSF